MPAPADMMLPPLWFRLCRLRINGLFQAAKRKARGYGRFQTMRTVIYLVAGNLHFSAINSHVMA